jgi:hypothetical protein
MQPLEKRCHVRFEVLAVKVQVKVFWFVMPCSVTLKMEAAWTSEMVSYHNTT